MRAITFTDKLQFTEDHPEPTPADGECLVRVHLAGICATDHHITDGYMKFNGVLGHEMVGTDGSMRADLTDQMLHKATATYEHPATIGVSMTGAPVSPPAQMLAQFVRDLLAGGKLTCSLEDGILNVATISAIHRSVESGTPVEVKELLEQ